MTPRERIFPGLLIGLGSIVLVGWIGDIDVLKSIVPGLGTMKVNTALGMIGLGLSFRWPRVAWIVAALGGATLVEYVAGVGLGIDQLLIPDPDSPLTSHPGRMSPITAFGFMLASLAHVRWAALPALGSLAALNLVAIIGYLYDVRPFFGATVFTTGIALHTVAGFLVFITGVAVTHGHAQRWGLQFGTTGQRLLRIGVVIAVVMPIMTGWLAVLGQRSGLLGPFFAVEIVVVALIFGHAAWSWQAAAMVGRAERAAQKAALEVAWANEKLEQRVKERTVQLELARARMTQLLHAAGEGIIGLDADGRITFCNPHGMRLLGQKNETAMFRQGHDTMFHGPHDDGSCVISDALRTGTTHRVPEEMFRRSDGSRFPVEYTVAPITAGDDIQGAVVIFEDITDRLEQRRALEESNTELEAYASIASHDLQAPLRHVRGFVDLLAEKQDQLDEEGQMFLDRTGAGVEQMQSVIDGLLAYSRLSTRTPDHGHVDLNEVLAYVLEVIEADVQAGGATIRYDVLPTIVGDPHRWHQVFQNLLLNAIRYRSPDRPLEVTISYELDHAHVIRITDNGQGFDQQYAERIFRMFQRLKKKDESGIGLGLAIVRRIVEQHGGRIRAEGALGSGATFIIQLPLGAA